MSSTDKKGCKLSWTKEREIKVRRLEMYRLCP
jgi:hypothetical protein